MKWFAPVLVGFWKIRARVEMLNYLLWLRSNTETHFSKLPFPPQSVLPPRFQKPLSWFEASTKEISTMSSFPLPEAPPPVCWLPSTAIWAASWLKPRPTPAACGLGRLPAIPADMCSSKRWMNNGGVQPEQCVLHQWLTQQVSSPKRGPTAHRNIDVQLRLRRQNAAKLTTWLP